MTLIRNARGLVVSPIHLKIVTDETDQPVAVQIEYADWLEIQRLLDLRSEADAAGSKSAGEGPAPNGRRLLHGSIIRYEDPFGPAADESEWDGLR
jgi:hypothetical protein